MRAAPIAGPGFEFNWGWSKCKYLYYAADVAANEYISAILIVVSRLGW